MENTCQRLNMETSEDEFQKRSKSTLDHTHPSIMVRGDTFQIRLEAFLESEFYKKFIKAIRSKRSTISQQDVSYRVISYWDTQGLIECERDSEKGWRKFNLVETLWLQVIQELRKFGLTTNTISIAKTYFFETNNNSDAVPYLDFYLASAMALNRPVCLIVFPSGACELFDHTEYKDALALQLLDIHLNLSLNDLLQKISVKAHPSYPLERELSKELSKVVDILNSSNYETATIRKKGNVIDRVELAHKPENDARIHEMLNQKEDQDIVVKKRRGKIIHVSQTAIEKI